MGWRAGGHVLVLVAGGERAAVPASTVEQVHRMVRWIPLPGTPPFVDGVIDIAGVLVPVVDLAARLGLPTRPPALDDHLVVVNSAGSRVALRADRADEVLELPAAAIEVPSGLATAADHVAGVAKLPEGMVLVHDVDRFLAAEEQAAVEEAIEIGASPP